MREAISRVGAKEKPVQQDAATSAWAATAPELTQHGGSYLADCQNAKPVPLEDPRNGHALWACDVKGAERRFVESEKLKSTRFFHRMKTDESSKEKMRLYPTIFWPLQTQLGQVG